MKTVLITGSSSGFGLALAEAYLLKGYRVLATLRNAQNRKKIFSSLSDKYPGKLNVLSLDVTSVKEREEVGKYISTNLGGKLDVLINNAGYGQFGALEETTEEAIRYQFEVNFFGVALLTKSLLPYLRAASGRVINISSTFGFSAFPLTSAYCSSKFAVEALSESLSYELSEHGVQVCVVAPGGYRTNFAMNVRWTEASDVYLLQTQGYQRLMQRLMSRRAKPITQVVGCVVALSESRFMPVRKRVGADAHFIYLWQKVLPNRFFTKIYSKLIARIFVENKKLVVR